MDIMELQTSLNKYEDSKKKILNAVDALKNRKIRLSTELEMAEKSEKESKEKLKEELIALGYDEKDIDLTPKGLEKIISETMENVTKATMEMDKALSEVGA